MDAISLGPFVLSFERFTALLSVVVLVAVAEVMARKTDERLAAWANNVVFIGLIAARLGFVLTHLTIYLADPLTIIYFWQGGFSVLSAAIAGLIYSAWFYRKDLRSAKWILTPTLAAVVIYFGLATFSSTRAPVVTELPSVTLEYSSGEVVDLASFVGQPTLVNIWATWCGPCQRELPMLALAEQEHPEVQFLFVDQRESAETVTNYLAKRNLSLKHNLLDLRGEAGDVFRVVGTPTTLFFDAEGQLVKRHVGEISRAALEDEFKKISSSIINSRR